MITQIDDTLKSTESVKRSELVNEIHQLIRQHNSGYEFDKSLAEEWADYVLLLLKGNKAHLANPYGDIDNFHVQSFSQSTPNLDKIDSLYILDSLPKHQSDNQSSKLLSQTLYITALGGTDSTFYKGLDADESLDLAEKFFAPDLVETFKKYDAVHLIPRGFAAKRAKDDVAVTNVESMIMQAYAAGIRNVAVIANAMTYRAISDYLQQKFHTLKDLNILVTAQPLLPRMKIINNGESLTIAEENGSYPGGHGHGFKYCLKDKNVISCIEKNNLRYFIFSNGDNAAVLNWGGNHFEHVLQKLQDLKKSPDHQNLRIGFFLVWEYLRKGGFSFLLKHKKTGEVMPQIFEAELAQKSGANIEQLKTSRGGYNTNVAIGLIKDVIAHLENLPMALKEKFDGDTFYSFEASLATAMTTSQSDTGQSRFDIRSSINILGPKTARYQHWNHIALRKREDLFAFFSSLFKVEDFSTSFGSFPIITTYRDATQKYPTLAGNVVSSDVLNTKSFFDIFANASFDVDQFYGTLFIELQEAQGKPLGAITFEGHITLSGDDTSEINIAVPAGEWWIVRDKNFHINKKMTITREDVIVKI